MGIRFEKIFVRDNGSVVRFVQIYSPSPIGVAGWDLFALVREAGHDSERLVTPYSSPDKSLGGLSVEEYMRAPKKGLLGVLSTGELLKAGQEAKEALKCKSRTMPIAGYCIYL